MERGHQGNWFVRASAAIDGDSEADNLRWKDSPSASSVAHVLRILGDVVVALRALDLGEEMEALVVLAELDISGESTFFPRRRLRDLARELCERYS